MMLKFIETEIRFNAPPVPVLLEKMCGQSELRTLSFLPICLTQIQRGTDLPHAWEHSLRRVKTTLTGEEIGLLQAFGAQLGTTDINGQISHCHMYDQLLDDKLSAALQKKQELSRMYISLGLFLGLAAAILFI